LEVGSSILGSSCATTPITLTDKVGSYKAVTVDVNGNQGAINFTFAADGSGTVKYVGTDDELTGTLTGFVSSSPMNNMLHGDLTIGGNVFYSYAVFAGDIMMFFNFYRTGGTGFFNYGAGAKIQ